MQPNLEHVIELTNAKGARVEERCSYVVTGYVLTHIELAKRLSSIWRPCGGSQTSTNSR